MLARALFRLPQSLALLLLASLSLGPSPSAATAACPTSSSTRPSQTQLRTLSRRQTDDDPDEAVFPDSLPTQIGFVFPRASEVRVGASPPRCPSSPGYALRLTSPSVSPALPRHR